MAEQSSFPQDVPTEPPPPKGSSPPPPQEGSPSVTHPYAGGGQTTSFQWDSELSFPEPTPNVPGYELHGELGRGGMGVVYKARQIRLNRLVALKMVLAGAHASAMQLDRFRTEAEAIARLQHPLIVSLYESGEVEGRPYFALEYVGGGSLSAQLGGTPMPARRAAQLVAQLASAIDYAHQSGVLHRDLKPANVLLTADGTPKITDFGLAKRLEQTSGYTRTGDILGTPSYMSPEQAEGKTKEIGPPADLYALGAILYETLTGKPPFRAETPFETVLQVVNEDPVPPTRLQPKLPRDLETICLKCLEKDPRRRYATCEDLRADLQRFLTNEPILARPVSGWERSLKWARRRPALAGMIGVSAAAALVLLGTSLAYVVHIKNANEQLRVAQDGEVQARKKAELRSELTRNAVDIFYTKVADEWLANQPNRDPEQRAFLEKALDVYKQLAQDGEAEPSLRRDTGLAYFRVGDIYRELNQLAAAEEAYRQALEIQQGLVLDAPTDRSYCRELATTWNWLGELLRTWEGRLGDSRVAFENARRLQYLLAAADPQDPSHKRELARSLVNLGIVHMDSGQPKGAEASFQEAIGLLVGPVWQLPMEPGSRHELARCLLNRGVLYRETGRLPQAEVDQRRAVALYEGLVADLPQRSVFRAEQAVALNNLGHVLAASTHPDQAVALHRHAEQVLNKLARDFPRHSTYRNELAATHNSLAAVLAVSRPPVRDLVAAEREWQKSEALFADLAALHPEVLDYRFGLGSVRCNLAWLQTRKRDWGRARSAYEAGIEELANALRKRPRDPRCLEALRRHHPTLAWVYLRLSQFDQALRACSEFPGYHPDRKEGCVAAARWLARQAKTLGENDGLTPEQRDELALRFNRQAIEYLREALQQHRANSAPWKDDPDFQLLRSSPEFAALVSTGS